MQIIEFQNFQEERALYGSRDVTVRHCTFSGEADGESAFKESQNIQAEDCEFCLRYPFWHDRGITVARCVMTESCRAPFWYSDQIQMKGSRLYGVKALRECSDVTISQCEIASAEFGWSSRQVQMTDCQAQGEYFCLRAQDLHLSCVKFTGKYSFQYVENASFDRCDFQTKDAFWHAKNVTVTDCEIRGEYLGWYSENLTLIRCKIFGTQPFCYCKNLTLVDCSMEDADLAFEKSDVHATLTAPVLSIKNPSSGQITLPQVGELILTDPHSKCKILCL